MQLHESEILGQPSYRRFGRQPRSLETPLPGGHFAEARHINLLGFPGMHFIRAPIVTKPDVFAAEFECCICFSSSFHQPSHHGAAYHA